MSHEQIIVETRGRAGIIRLNLPDRLNAIGSTMRDELFGQLREWNSDDSVGAIVLTGEGRAYSAGADIANFEQRISGHTASDGEAEGWAQTFRSISKPIICAINGVAVGIGLTHTLLCDIRLAIPDARMSFRFVRLGITPELGSTHMLPKLVGLGRATELMLTARFFTGQEAKEMGLVLEVYPKEELVDRAVELAQTIAEAPVWHLAETKRLLRENAVSTDFEAIDAEESVTFNKGMDTAEFREAVTAFREKRDPKFH
jgi:2-(1,2-epoxy-1,2-dihydrophenyl)acetyl-CoA isomerase